MFWGPKRKVRIQLLHRNVQMGLSQQCFLYWCHHRCRTGVVCQCNPSSSYFVSTDCDSVCCIEILWSSTMWVWRSPTQTSRSWSENVLVFRHESGPDMVSLHNSDHLNVYITLEALLYQVNKQTNGQWWCVNRLCTWKM